MGEVSGKILRLESNLRSLIPLLTIVFYMIKTTFFMVTEALLSTCTRQLVPALIYFTLLLQSAPVEKKQLYTLWLWPHLNYLGLPSQYVMKYIGQGWYNQQLVTRVLKWFRFLLLLYWLKIQNLAPFASLLFSWSNLLAQFSNPF